MYQRLTYVGKNRKLGTRRQGSFSILAGPQAESTRTFGTSLFGFDGAGWPDVAFFSVPYNWALQALQTPVQTTDCSLQMAIFHWRSSYSSSCNTSRHDTFSQWFCRGDAPGSGSLPGTPLAADGTRPGRTINSGLSRFLGQPLISVRKICCSPKRQKCLLICTTLV